MWRIAALAVFLLFGFFLYWNSPKTWKKIKGVHALIILLHLLGAVCLTLLFGFFRLLPENALKYAVLMLGSFYYVATVYSGVCLLICRIYCRFCRKAGFTKNRFYRFLVKPECLVSAILILLAVFGICGYLNSGKLFITDYSLSIPKSCEVKTLRAAVLSDVHLGAGTMIGELPRLSEKIADIDPQVILIPGDLADETTSAEDLSAFCSMLSKFHPEYGIYCISGNHDAGCHYDLQPYLSGAGITVLKDRAVTFAGITLIGRKDHEQDRKGLEKILADNRIDTKAPVLLMEHRPRGLSSLSGTGCDLVLCGHTHGVSYPGSGFILKLLYSPVRGERRFGDLTAITSSGVSKWGIRFKLPAKNEVLRLNLSFDGE
jgi:predicted MPP superfamily phosphohydrolase